MKRTKRQNKPQELAQIQLSQIQELNQVDAQTLFGSKLGVSIIDIANFALVFFGNIPLPPDFQAQCTKCISDIASICTDAIIEVVIKTDGKFGYNDFNRYFSKNTPFSPTLDDIFTSLEPLSTHPTPTPAICQKVLELVTLSWCFKHLANYFYQQNNQIYALAFSNTSSEVLGFAKNLYGLPQDTDLKFELLSDDDKQSIHKKIQREQGRKHALKATEPQRQERKLFGEKYLRIMQEHGFTNWTQTAEYIFMHANPENKSFNWIIKTLKAADKSEI